MGGNLSIPVDLPPVDEIKDWDPNKLFEFLASLNFIFYAAKSRTAFQASEVDGHCFMRSGGDHTFWLQCGLPVGPAYRLEELVQEIRHRSSLLPKTDGKSKTPSVASPSIEAAFRPGKQDWY